MAHKSDLRGKISLGLEPGRQAVDKMKVGGQLTAKRVYFYHGLFQLRMAVWCPEAKVVWKSSDHLLRIDPYSYNRHLQQYNQ